MWGRFHPNCLQSSNLCLQLRLFFRVNHEISHTLHALYHCPYLWISPDKNNRFINPLRVLQFHAIAQPSKFMKWQHLQLTTTACRTTRTSVELLTALTVSLTNSWIRTTAPVNPTLQAKSFGLPLCVMDISKGHISTKSTDNSEGSDEDSGDRLSASGGKKKQRRLLAASASNLAVIPAPKTLLC